MTPHVVADIGNTRIKWAICPTLKPVLSLPDDVEAWSQARNSLPLLHPARWLLAGVRPERGDRLTDWLRAQGDVVVQLTHAQIPLSVGLEQPSRVGIDRLLNAVAAIDRLKLGEPAVLIDAGSAVTVDWLDEQHVFQGGTIFPGLELMAQALHRYTALLPQVTITLPIPSIPGKATIPAMQSGVYHAVVGGIRGIVAGYRKLSTREPQLFLTGGQASLLSEALPGVNFWPEQTLFGILRCAEALP